MKSGIHPKYYDDCQVTCTCGNKFSTGSTLPKIEVEICSACHPLFTGEMKYIDTKGRIERFREKQAKGQAYQKKIHAKKKQAKKTLSFSQVSSHSKKKKNSPSSAKK